MDTRGPYTSGDVWRSTDIAGHVRAAVPRRLPRRRHRARRHTTFAGRRVAQFQSMETQVGETTVSWRPGMPPPVRARNPHYIYALIDWYVDPATARPVGFKAWGCMGDQIRSCERRQGPPSTTRIVTFQRLDPTPQNLALLTGPGAPPGAK
jgi:hypothetical protein